jgi:hypothetical protein
MATFEHGLFMSDDFLQIENVLYSPKEEELAHRKIFRLNTSYARYAEEIGYDYYKRQGSAKILAKGGSAKDIPFVGEEGGRITQKAYTIVSGIRYSQAEQEAIQEKRALGKGPAVQLDTLRVSSARRFIFEKESTLAFKGDSAYGIKGIFDSTFYGTDLGTSERVATGTSGYKWSQKTAREILTDLETAMNKVEEKGLFKAKVLVLSPQHYNRLRKPFSDTGDSRTLLTWLNSEGMFFEQIVVTNQMLSTYNGDANSYNYFMVLDNDPEVVELALLYDIELGDPVYDIVGTMEQAVTLKTGCIICRHPSALYIGKDI